jgi:hypothetical protein
MAKYTDLGFGINIPDHILKSFVTVFWVKNTFFADPEPGSGAFLSWIRDSA